MSVRGGRNIRAAYYKTLGVKGVPTSKIHADFTSCIHGNSRSSGASGTTTPVQHHDIVDNCIVSHTRLMKLHHQYGYLPASCRAMAWKIILGVLPPSRGSWEYVKQQHDDAYEDVVSACKVCVGDSCCLTV